MLAQAVGSTPWRLLYVIAPAELNAVILPRLVPYGIILAGLILTLLLAHTFRQRVIVRPALAFADYIRAESADRHPPQPRLPAFWQPLVTATGEAFRAQRSSLAQIQDSEAMKSAIIASAFDAVIAIDEAGLVVEFNPSAEQMFGIAGAQARGQPLAELIVPAHLRAGHRRGMERYLASGRSAFLGRRVELEALRADGTRFPVEVAVSEVRQAGRRLFAAYLRDITERRAMERALRESEQHFRVDRREPSGPGRDRPPRRRQDRPREPGLCGPVRHRAGRAARPGHRALLRRPRAARPAARRAAPATARCMASSSTSGGPTAACSRPR